MDYTHFGRSIPAPSNGYEVTLDEGRTSDPEKHIWNRWVRATTSGISGVSEGWLVPLLLVSMQEGNSSGARIKARVEELGFGIPRPGTVYRVLHAMEKEGLVVSNHSEAEVLLSRWNFKPTEAGMAYLEFWTSSLEQYRDDIERFLRVCERSGETPRSYGSLEVLHGGLDREQPDVH